MIIEKIIRGIKAWWANFTMSQDERWLSQSADVVELENRLRQIWGYNKNTLST